ncbi:MAG: sigma-54-dependent Fis family transcriptional regulator [Nitrospirae bacterium]|nr:sigma-54-dependent Fis family transcriptional regulator [Nitrospirota bacterium]
MLKPLLLVVEDDESIGLSLRAFFEGRGFTVMNALTGQDGLSIALREIPDTVILDLRLPDKYGIEVLCEIKKSYPEISVIVMTGYGEVEEAVKAMKLGAEYYFQKPIDIEELAVIVEKSLGIRQIRQEAVLHRRSSYPIIGRSMHTQGLIHMINLLGSNSSTTVLIQGETGTGKELMARNIHAVSSRSEKPFIDINCAAIPEQIVESELFGYEAGAFTDAKKTKKGLVELADGGTLFLDEIGDMPLSAQAKILRVLETRTLKRLGGTRDISVDVRFIAATNKDLGGRVKDGSFREDLFYRLNVMPLQILPLRNRPEDIPLIAEFLLETVKKSIGKKELAGFTGDALDLLSSYFWPGNVRELRNVIERAAILCQDTSISAKNLILPAAVRMHFQEDDQLSSESGLQTLSEVEQAHIRRVLELTGGNRTRAAQILGIARSTLNEKLKLFSLL